MVINPVMRSQKKHLFLYISVMRYDRTLQINFLYCKAHYNYLKLQHAID